MNAVLQSMSRAFSQLEMRKINPQTGLLLNYTDDDGRVCLPNSEDYLQGRPNHLGWNSPTEDGGYYNGLYLDALCCRAQYLGDQAAQTAAGRIAHALCRLSELGLEGFIARGWCLPEMAHYACGSDDQTFPWLYGLWRFVRSGIGTAEETDKCRKAIIRTAEALRRSDFRIPCDYPEFGWRGDYRGRDLRDICKLAFVCLMMYDLTGKTDWLKLYEKNWNEKPLGSPETRLERIEHDHALTKYDGSSVFYCLENGEAMGKVFGEKRKITGQGLFILCMIHIALNALLELDTDTSRRVIFLKVLHRDAAIAATHLIRHRELEKMEWPAFSDDWRKMNSIWYEQHSSQEAASLAWAQMPIWFETCPRFPFENAFVREPLFAACIVAFGNDADVLEKNSTELKELLTVIPWERLNTSTYYAALLAHGQLMRNGCMRE